MPGKATVTVDLAKVTSNMQTVVAALPGVEVVGVTKVVCGSPEVAAAMLEGGAVAIGESRLENVQRLRDAGIGAPIWLLRGPTPDLADDTVRLTDVSLESEIVTVEALDRAAGAAGRTHAIVAMVELGDLREGVMPEQLPAFLERAAALDHVRIAGIGASLTCYGAIRPSEDNLGELAALVDSASGQLGTQLLMSGGSSTSIGLVAAGRAPSAIDNLRIGEAILLGVDPATREGILRLHQDVITVSAPVIECAVKPSKPMGVCAQDAFGNVPHFEDRGSRLRAICALGRQDAPPDGLRPLDPRVEVLGASSDHLIIDVDALEPAPAIGDMLEFAPSYAATLQLFTSPYVEKRYL